MSEKVKGKNLTPKQQDGLKTMGFVILCAAALFWWSTSQKTPGVDNTTSVEDDFTEQPPVLSNQDAPPPSPAPFILSMIEGICSGLNFAICKIGPNISDFKLLMPSTDIILGPMK